MSCFYLGWQPYPHPNQCRVFVCGTITAKAIQDTTTCLLSIIGMSCFHLRWQPYPHPNQHGVFMYSAITVKAVQDTTTHLLSIISISGHGGAAAGLRLMLIARVE